MSLSRDYVAMDSERGKAILAHAMRQEYCVLEFQEDEDGEMMVADITEHVEQLEKIADT